MVVDNNTPTTATTTSFENVQKLMKDSDDSMTKLGYHKVGISKVRIDKKHITNITVRYTKV